MVPRVSVIIPTMDRSDDVITCIDSVAQSTYPNIEIIVVDNGSTDDTVARIKNQFGQLNNLKLIESAVNLGAGGGRNRGAREANGEYLLFVDSDNSIDEEMIAHLVSFFETHADCGMVGPLMLYQEDPTIIWLYFADINMYTSQAIYRGTGEKDVGQYGSVVKVGHLPNCFMVRSDEFWKVGGFDERYIVMYEEAELAEKIKQRLRKCVYLYPKAVTHHNVELNAERTRNDVIFSASRQAYLVARNRIYFMKRNASPLQQLIFFLIFNNVSLLYYEVKLLRRREFAKAWAYLRGWAIGFFL